MLYGNAILKYNELQLDTSTPQMIVLLQFNAANVSNRYVM